MLLLDRHTNILRNLKLQGSVKVSELSKKFKVTEETIRRDLEKLEKNGHLQRTHGGAVRMWGDLCADEPYQIRDMRNAREKKMIGEFAASMIDHGDVIILDASTTALQVASAIKKRGLRDLTVLTNAINVALRLVEQPGISLICVGGMLEERSLSFVGPLAEKNVQNYHARKAFISCKAISSESGIADADEMQARLKSKMVAVSKETYLLVDRDKFGRTAFVSVTPIASVHKLVTNEGAPADEIEFYREKGLEVFVVKDSDYGTADHKVGERFVGRSLQP